MNRENLALLLYSRILILKGRPISAEIAPFSLFLGSYIILYSNLHTVKTDMFMTIR